MSVLCASGISADQSSFGEDVALDRFEHVGSRGFRSKLELAIKSVQPEEVVVCSTRRARPSVADLTEIVRALSCVDFTTYGR